MSSVLIQRLVNIVNVGNNTAMLSGGNKQRLDKYLVQNGLITSRSQAENYIRLGDVMVNNKVIQKPGAMVSSDDKVEIGRAHV